MGASNGQLNRAELRKWVQFLSGTRSLFQALDQRLRQECGLSMDDFEVLAAIQWAPDPKMGDLAHLVSFSPSRLTNVIQRMEANGWVERETTSDDKRVKVVSLTRSGKRVLDDAWPSHAQVVRELFLDQLDEDSETFIDTFRRIRKAGST